MEARIATKPRRHKKRKSRTQVSSDSDSSDSDADRQEKKPTQTDAVNATSKKEQRESARVQDAASNVKPATTAETAVSTEFTKYLMQRATLEFADDLNAIRSADDFRGAESVSILVHALQQGTSTFSIDDQTRVVSAGKAEKEMDG